MEPSIPADLQKNAGAACAGGAGRARRSRSKGRFLDEKGLPNRPWFRHMLIGPGLTSGYASRLFPALQQAMKEEDAALFAEESKRVVAAIQAGTARLSTLQ